MEKSIDRLPLFLDPEEVEVGAKNGFEIPFPEKPIVMAVVHHPVSFSFLVGMMFEAGRKTGEEKVAPRLENRNDISEIAPGISPPDMMQTAVVEDDIERRRPEGETEDISEHKSKIRPGRPVPGDPASPLQREGLVIETDGPVSLAREEGGVSSFAATDIENLTGPLFLLELLQKLNDRR